MSNQKPLCLIPNFLFEDQSLSWGCLGFLVYLFSSDKFDRMTLAILSEHFKNLEGKNKMGRTKLKKLVDEAISLGYIVKMNDPVRNLNREYLLLSRKKVKNNDLKRRRAYFK